MNHFAKDNALKATLINLVINTVAPFFIFMKNDFINLKGEAPTLVNLLLPTVLISVFATTLVTFITMTKQRMTQKLAPTLTVGTAWLPTALLTSVGLALIFGGLAFGLISLVQMSMTNVPLLKLPALLLSGVVGAGVAYIASFIAVKRAALIQ